LLSAHGGFRAIFGPFASWDLLIGLANEDRARLGQVRAPVALIDARTEERTPMDSYRLQLEQNHSPLAQRVGAGWLRLQFVWQSAVIEAHRELFGRYVSTIVPNLTRQYSRLEAWASEKAERDAAPVPLSAPWLNVLAQGGGEEPLRLVRRQEGDVYLIDQGRRREVASALLVRVLERAFGLATVVSEDEAVGYEAGPPVVVFADEFHEHFLIAGDKRYVVSGLLLPWQVATSDLARFELAEMVLDVTEC
jgi:hypothetical protein